MEFVTPAEGDKNNVYALITNEKYILNDDFIDVIQKKWSEQWPEGEAPKLFVIPPGMSLQMLSNRPYHIREKHGEYETEITFASYEELLGYLDRYKEEEEEE